MTHEPHRLANRLERRKHRTRTALIKAAQGFTAVGRLNVPVLEITQAADVGMGSFYNHFDSKEQLFLAALDENFDLSGALLDRLYPHQRCADRPPLAQDLLVVYGLPAEEAREVCTRALPDLDDLPVTVHRTASTPRSPRCPPAMVRPPSSADKQRAGRAVKPCPRRKARAGSQSRQRQRRGWLGVARLSNR
jgi:AcrR family transcriptional regulator